VPLPTNAVEPAEPGAEATRFSATTPILPRSSQFPVGEYWAPGKIGDRDFYFADQGPYQRMKAESIAALRQVGLLDRMIPGHWTYDINNSISRGGDTNRRSGMGISTGVGTRSIVKNGG